MFAGVGYIRILLTPEERPEYITAIRPVFEDGTCVPDEVAAAGLADAEGDAEGREVDQCYFVIDPPSNCPANSREMPYEGMFYGVQVQLLCAPFEANMVSFDSNWLEKVQSAIPSVGQRPTPQELLDRDAYRRLEAEELADVDASAAEVVENPQPITMHIKSYTGNEFDFRFDESTPVGELREEIFQATGIELEELVATVNDRLLQPDHYTLKRFGLCTGDTVYVHPPRRFLPTQLEDIQRADSGDGTTCMNVTIPHFFYLPIDTDAQDCQFMPAEALLARRKALRRLCSLFKDHRLSDIHWYLRSSSPSSRTVWTPETDHHWPHTFRVITRYIAKIRCTKENGICGEIPHDVAGVICGFL